MTTELYEQTSTLVSEAVKTFCLQQYSMTIIISNSQVFFEECQLQFTPLEAFYLCASDRQQRIISLRQSPPFHHGETQTDHQALWQVPSTLRPLKLVLDCIKGSLVK